MINQQKNFLTFSFVVILVGAISIYIYKDLHKPVSSPISQPEGNQNLPVSIISGKPGQNYKIEAVPIASSSPKTAQKSPKIPNLSLPAVNHSQLDNTTFEIVAKNIGILANDLKKDPKDELKWLNLAIFRKMLGDYGSSVEILNYIAILWPNDYVPYNNLADLYQFYIKNYPLAEKNWLKVIELKPDYTDAYENLFTLYTTAYKEKQDHALPILIKGLGQNPQNTGLMVNIARYYRTAGDKAQAINYYTKAINEAKAQKNDQLELSFQTEMAETLK